MTTNLFGAHSTTDEVLSGVNLRGKRILVTGVSAGLGVETARALVAHGAQVVGAARDLAKADGAMTEVRKAAAKAKRDKEARVHALEMKIAALEGQQKKLVAALEDPTAYEPGGRAVAINRELSAVTHNLAQVSAEWETATTVV